MANYATKAEVKAQIGKTKTTLDDEIDAMIMAASMTIDGYCNRPDGFESAAAASARVFSGTGKPWLHIDEFAAITSVAVKSSITDTAYTAWASTDWAAFQGDPQRPTWNRTPYDGLMVGINGDYAAFLNGTLDGIVTPTVQVVAKWGYATTVPDAIKQACITQVARWLKRGESGWSDVLASGEMGQLMYQKMLDPAVKMILVGGRFVRPAVG